MPKEEWGVKRVCPTTNKRFYDLNKTPVVSPYTGEVVNLDSARTSRVLVSDKADRKPKAAAEAADDEEDLLIDDEDIADDEADTDVDDSLLDDDEDDDTVSLDDIADVSSDNDDS